MTTENEHANDPRCSRGAVIGTSHTIEDAERDSLLPPQRIHWNIRREGKVGPSMEYVRIDVHEAVLTTVRKEVRDRALKECAGLARTEASIDTHKTARQTALNIAAAIEAAANKAEPQFVADNRFEITCGHCGTKFWMFDIASVRLCRSCFLLGHRGNGGNCWKCRSDYYSDDEPFATHGDD